MSNNKFNRKSDDLNNLIKSKLKDKVSITNISKTLKVSRPTIYNIKNNIKKETSGPKIKYNEKNLKYQVEGAVKVLEKKGQKISAKKILHYLTEEISLRTLQSYLNKSKEFELRNIKKKITLTQLQKDNRLRICRSWFEDNINFEKIIFSDECRCSLDGPDNFFTWQLWNSPKQTFRQKRAFGGGSIMLYGFIGFDGFFFVKKNEGSLTGLKYASFLENDILPMLKTRYGPEIIYQHDNARPHISKDVRQIFEKAQINVLNWPPYSPDINIIENVWRLLKDLIYDGPGLKNKEDLWTKVEKAVKIINEKEPSTIRTMYKCYTKRVLDVIQKHGDIL